MAKAETRRVLIVPGPVFRTLPATVHPLPVSPAGTTGAVPGVGAATAESKVRSHWKPMYFRPGSIDVLVTDVVMVKIGAATLARAGEGEGVPVGVGLPIWGGSVAVGLGVGVGLGGVGVAVGVG